MKKKIIYSDDFLGENVKVKVMQDFLPPPNELVLKKDFRERSDTKLGQLNNSLSMPQTNFAETAIA
jgi:hypothetical protein